MTRTRNWVTFVYSVSALPLLNLAINLHPCFPFVFFFYLLELFICCSVKMLYYPVLFIFPLDIFPRIFFGVFSGLKVGRVDVPPSGIVTVVLPLLGVTTLGPYEIQVTFFPKFRFIFGQIPFFSILVYWSSVLLPFLLILPSECGCRFSLFLTWALDHKWPLHVSTRFQTTLC